MTQCSETSIQQKRLHTSVNNAVIFSVMETDTTSLNNVVIFPVMDTDHSTHLISVCSETSIQQKGLPTSINNVVLFQLWRQIPLQWTMWYFTSVMETDPTSVKMWNFFSYGDRLLNPFNCCMQWNLNPKKTSFHLNEQCGTFFQLWR